MGLRTLGAEEYGRWNAAFLLAVSAGNFATGWMSQSFLKFGYSQQTLNALGTRWAPVSITAGAAASAGLSPLALGLSGTTVLSLLSMAATGGGAAVGSLYASSMQANDRIVLSGLSDLLRSSALGIWFAIGAAQGLRTDLAALAAVSAYFAATLALWLFAVRPEPDPATMPGALSLSQLSRYGTPLAFWILLSAIYQIADRVALIHLDSPEAAGLYSAVYDLCTRPVNLVLLSAGVYFQASYFRLQRTGKRELAGRQLRVALLATTALGACLGLLIALTIELAPTSRLGLPEQPSPSLTLPIIAAAVVWALALTEQRRVQMAERTASLLGLLSLSVLVNLGLNALLIPALGPSGAALATLAASSSYLAGVRLLARRLRGEVEAVD